MTNKRVLVAHPFKQHSYRLAKALNNDGLLDTYVTTVYEKDHSLSHYFGLILGDPYKHKIQSKRCEGLDDAKVHQIHEIRGLLFLSLIRLPILKRMYRAYGRHLCNTFGKKVAKYAIKRNVKAVVMYDTTACSCFEYIKAHAPWIKCILDVSSIPSMSRIRIYERIMKDEESQALYIENSHLWNKKFNKNNSKEIQLADFFLSPSSFVSDCLIECGAKLNSILKLPYGVDTSRFSRVVISPSLPLRLVYTGSVIHGKGLHYLLKLVRELKGKVHLDIFGGVDATTELYQDYCKENNISFHGFVSHDIMLNYYKKAHLFVFPSLGEGFSLAALEAMSSGLPIICTTNSGINDIVSNGINGYVVGAGNYNELMDIMTQLIESPDLLKSLGQNAWITAQEFTWERYNSEVIKIISHILD